MTMGERIAAKRKQKGFTQEYMAERLGISRQSVSKWEKNVTKPDTANLMRLCDLLDTDAGYRGGYASFIFNKYSDDLMEKYVSGHGDKEKIISAVAVPGSRQAHWSGRRMYLSFVINTQYKNRTDSCKVTFFGHRQWTDSYTWGGAVIEG